MSAETTLSKVPGAVFKKDVQKGFNSKVRTIIQKSWNTGTNLVNRSNFDAKPPIFAVRC